MATDKRDQLDQFYDRLQTLPGLIRELGLSIAEAQRRLDQNYIESLASFTKIMSWFRSNLPDDTLTVTEAASNAVAEAGKLVKKNEAAAAVATAAREALGPKSSDQASAIVKAADDAVTAGGNEATSLAAAQFVARAANVKFEEMLKASGLSPSQYLELFREIAPSHYQFTETAVEVRADLRVASASELQLGAEFGINKAVFSAAVNFSYLKRTASDYQAAAALRCVINAIPADQTMLKDLFDRAGTPITAAFKSDASFKTTFEALREWKRLPEAK